MTMYSDLAAYNEPVAHHSNKASSKKNNSLAVKKAPSLGSLDGKTNSVTTNSFNSRHHTTETNSSKESTPQSKFDVENDSITVMAETAQVEMVNHTTANNGDKSTAPLESVDGERVKDQQFEDKNDSNKEEALTVQTHDEREFMFS